MDAVCMHYCLHYDSVHLRSGTQHQNEKFRARLSSNPSRSAWRYSHHMTHVMNTHVPPVVVRK